jgi:AraC-like DNA-binding protein
VEQAPAGRQKTGQERGLILFEERPCDSPFVEKIWRCHSERSGEFISVAASHFEMVVTRYRGKSFLTLRGPETKATTAECPADGEWIAIRFKIGTFMPHLLPISLRDRKDVTLPDASSRSFWLNGSAWEYPDFENADTFVKRLAKAGLILGDPTVDAVLRGQVRAQSLRSAQRHFLGATGMTRGAFRQIERARYATNLLRDGFSIADAVHLAGYFDQAHLNRSLKHFVGQTPTKIIRRESQLSFLYKTEPHRLIYSTNQARQNDDDHADLCW